ncbi:MAG TPA: hypothetical protein VKE94_19480 [Gemmataceae bacterium]|nr:hypothetical protein [Gemmataceae bacterium]
MYLRTSLVALLVLARPGLAQSTKHPQLPNPLSLLNTSSTEAIAGNFRAALVKAMPSPLYEDAKTWGRTKDVTTIHWRGQGLAVHPEKVIKQKKDGDWRKTRLTADNLADTLVFDLRGLQSPEPGRVTFTIFLSFDASVRSDHQKWNEGTKLWNTTLKARMRVKLALDCELTARLDDKGELLPDAVIRLHATKADLKYDNLVVEHAAGLGGAAAKLIGDAAHRIVNEFKPSLERDLLAKADAAIVKAADTKEIHVKLSDLLVRKARKDKP